MMHHIRPYRIFQHLGTDNKVKMTIPTLPGTESLTVMSLDTLLLIAVARITDAKSVLEIGTGLGYTALHLVQNTFAHVITIDSEEKPTVFEGTGWARSISRVVGDIHDAEAIPCDMVFCDINPDLELCRTCTDLAISCDPKVIAWHDYGNPTYPAQTENLDQLSQSYEIYHVEDSWMCFWFSDGRVL